MVQHSSMPREVQRTITSVGSWTLSVCRPIICCSVSSPLRVCWRRTLYWSLTKRLFFLYLLRTIASRAARPQVLSGIRLHITPNNSRNRWRGDQRRSLETHLLRKNRHLSRVCGVERRVCFLLKLLRTRVDGLHDHRSCIGSATFPRTCVTSGIFELSCFSADPFLVKLTLTCTATSRDIRTTWRSFCVFKTAVPEVSATELDFATSLCEDSCTGVVDKFKLLV